MKNNFDYSEELIAILNKEYLEKVIKPSFPFISYIGRTSWGMSGDSRPKISFELSRMNVDFKGSEYYYSKANQFIHYTSLANVVNIINDGYIRLNSLSYMDDPQELLFALPHEEINDFKKYIFSLSFCEYDEINNPDNFDAWRLYGDSGNGVGIVFEFEPTWDHWTNNYLSNIHYGMQISNAVGTEETTKKFNLFIENLETFISKYAKDCEIVVDMFGSRKIPEWLTIFLAFHKSSLYKIENEVRYLRLVDKEPKNFTLNNQLQKTCYEKLFIKRNFSHKLEAMPRVKFKNIILGYKRAKDFNKLRLELKNGLAANDYHSVDVILSPIEIAFK